MSRNPLSVEGNSPGRAAAIRQWLLMALVHADSVCGGDLLYPRDAGLRQVDALEAHFGQELGPHLISVKAAPC
jgi:hypothetical protein